ncbi:hypothetical protein YC2023_054669 [Brassica napus]
MFNTKFHVVIITLNLVLVYAGGRIIPPGSVPSTSMKSLSVDDTINLNPKNQIFRGAEVKSCKPKGFRPRSAPSRFVNYQPLVSVNCSSSKNPEEFELELSLPSSLSNNASLSSQEEILRWIYFFQIQVLGNSLSYELEDIFVMVS